MLIHFKALNSGRVCCTRAMTARKSEMPTGRDDTRAKHPNTLYGPLAQDIAQGDAMYQHPMALGLWKTESVSARAYAGEASILKTNQFSILLGAALWLARCDNVGYAASCIDFPFLSVFWRHPGEFC